ncbi:conserved hypothetical protein [Planktothrix serta PCC 8927]|uniref:DUF1232 domain-containing protein n=1 Tax=Planktothrix serta PCC 8927 TaxID=671068 RepID=A0A7Z9E2Z0_9CYAN|nr:YkvA family protein [Planktothrix serta]VXD23122.1 conserved hypothetical protein [Planktothrix serta PCC 8927]
MKNLIQSFYNWYRVTLRNTKYRWVVILGSLIYLVSPLDISPDFLPIVGWLDDGVIATILVTEVSQLLIEGLNRRKQANKATEVNEVESVSRDQTVVDVSFS